MKNLFLLIAVMAFNLGLQSQTTYQWFDTLTINHAIDTVIYPNETGDISGYSYSFSFQTVNLGSTDTIEIGVGGSNVILTGTMRRPITTSFCFQPNNESSFPYYFTPVNNTNVTNGVTRYMNQWKDTGKFLSMRPGIYIKTHGDTSLVINWGFIFAK
jgi:hypothetical protein